MQKSISDIAIDFSSSSRILFSTMILASTYAISILILLLSSLFLSSSSIFVLAADPGMASPPPTTTPSPPPATTTGEKPGIVPVPPPPPTASTAIDKLLGLQKTPPIVEQKTDPKDGDTILSSKIKTDITVATKVAKKSLTKTLDWNRGYLDGIQTFFNPSKKFKLTAEELQKKLLNPTSGLTRSQISKLGEDYIRGVMKGFKDALILDDMLRVIPGQKPQ